MPLAPRSRIGTANSTVVVEDQREPPAWRQPRRRGLRSANNPDSTGAARPARHALRYAARPCAVRSCGRTGCAPAQGAAQQRGRSGRRAPLAVSATCRWGGPLFASIPMREDVCRQGAICPGGFRMWPTEGYWNDGEVRTRLSRDRVTGVSPVSAQMWRGSAQSRCRRGGGQPSPRADVGRDESGPGADVAGVSPVPVQMWQGCAQSRC